VVREINTIGGFANALLTFLTEGSPAYVSQHVVYENDRRYCAIVQALARIRNLLSERQASCLELFCLFIRRDKPTDEAVNFGQEVGLVQTPDVF
jgi:hypothetical protein